MASQKKNWFISDIARNAQTNIENLNIEFREEVIKRFECLEKNPFFVFYSIRSSGKITKKT